METTVSTDRKVFNVGVDMLPFSLDQFMDYVVSQDVKLVLLGAGYYFL
jgi:hypothetical protein